MTKVMTELTRKDRYIEALEKDIQYKNEKYRALFIAVSQTLSDNLHLCDGDVCTLKVLRDEFIAQGGEL